MQFKVGDRVRIIKGRCSCSSWDPIRQAVAVVHAEKPILPEAVVKTL